MLRNEVLIWVLIFWIMLTCIIVLDLYVRIEKEKTTKKIDAITEDVATIYNPLSAEVIEKIEPVEVTNVEPESVEIKALPTVSYFDVPLSEDLQSHIFKLCDENGVNPSIVVAMIGKESVYNSDAVGDGGNSLGLMQIQPRWHRERMKKLGTTNLFDPYQNVAVGIDILAELFATGKSTEWVLMAYNGGRAYANEKSALDIVSDYANTVMSNAVTLNTYTVVVEEVE